MSRRAPNPAAERAAQNQATIKSLLKLEPNKVCADCKRNKHPRWASWNLGVFVCIRCSGIHRGMGTHISRVKSVDLDSWTDEQLQSILSWGNARANKYWEAKLAAGHAPSEAKIENFIRTKYELKRWVMDGPMPDPATLDVDGDDDVPSASPRGALAPEADLIGGDDPIPARASTVSPAANRVAPKAEPAAPKATNTKDSLLGLDFLGGSTAPPRPSSTPGVTSPGGQSRPDLKQSILSLYATAPKPQPQHQPQHHHHASQQQHGQFGGMPSPPMAQQGGFNDAFSSLSIGNNAPRAPAADPFAGLGGGSSGRSNSQTSSSNAFGGLSGGSFFDAKPSGPVAPYTNRGPLTRGSAGSARFHLLQLSPPLRSPPSPRPWVTSLTCHHRSVFNLSSPQNKPATSPPAAATSASALGGMGMADPWGGNEWATPAPAPAPAPAAPAKASPELTKTTSSSLGWGSGGAFASTPIVPGSGGGFNPAPKVAADEEFGGWASSAAPANTNAAAPKQSGFGGDEDLFSNVWQ
ncbi:hypothetical protein ACCO45_004066 [Purpureocillium lilacinum]|uniref:Uncharacterized protein n=1 Tax=Purpureocillium lilacinum TaxID=33203 RepID=A0ACC4E4U4_PURLI